MEVLKLKNAYGMSLYCKLLGKYVHQEIKLGSECYMTVQGSYRQGVKFKDF